MSYISYSEEVMKKIFTQVLAEIEATAEKIFTESQAIVPVETGQLRDSGKVSKEVSGNSATVYVSYDTVYAVRQHEEPFAHAPGKSFKYLEKPFNEIIPELLSKLR